MSINRWRTPLARTFIYFFLSTPCPKGHRFTQRFTENPTYVLLFTLIFITLKTFPIFNYTSSLFLSPVYSPSLQALSLAFLQTTSLLCELCFGSYPRLRAVLILFPVILIGFKVHNPFQWFRTLKVSIEYCEEIWLCREFFFDLT